jgi:transposase InsO family protein
MTVSCTLSKNGIAHQLPGLIDSGANGYAFVDGTLLKSVSRFFKPFISPLPSPIPVKGYNGQNGAPITHYAVLNLTIDRRIQSFTPFLITSLGNHGLILGRSWLAEHKILLDSARRKLIWPVDYPPTLSYAKRQLLTKRDFKEKEINKQHQKDANRRDRLFELDCQRSKAGRRSITVVTASTPQLFPQPGAAKKIKIVRFDESLNIYIPPTVDSHSFVKDYSLSLLKMENELSSQYLLSDNPPQRPQKKRRPKPLWKPQRQYPIDITVISGVAFHMNIKHNESSELFTATLHELDGIIDQMTNEKDKSNQLADLTQRFVTKSLPHGDYSTYIDQIMAIQEGDEPPIPPEHMAYQHVFSKAESDILPPHRPYDHRILLEGEGEKALKYSPLYRMSLPELEAVKKYIEDNLSKGFIEPSQAPFAAPILFVKKPDGSLRLCIDFRALNNLTRKDRYPLPLIDETLARLAGARIFTKLDIRQAFHRIRMDPTSEEYTTFRTRYGAYKCKVLPFGLTNGPATYQRYMNDVLFDYLDDFCTAYLDDILIYSDNELEHTAHVHKVLQRLSEAGLQADLKKCEFNVKRTKYLGFIISTNGIEVDPDKISVVKEWQYPTTVKGVQSFLGFCNFYRRFIRDYGIIARPLVNLTRTNTPFKFDFECCDAFDQLKASLTSAPILQHYNPDLECMLETDASDGVVASVLSQKHGGDWLPVAFFSKTMAPAELNYAVHDKEMLAIIRSFGHFRAELTGSPHTTCVYTDHKALEYFMTSKTLNSRQARWAEVLANYHFMIMYRPGKQNPLADALTRRVDELNPQNVTKRDQRFQQLLRDDQIDSYFLEGKLRQDTPEENLINNLDLAPISPALGIVDQVLAANRAAPSLQALRRKAASETPGDFVLSRELLLYKERLLVPDIDNIRTLLIREVHDQVSTAHPSANKTFRMLAKQYYWHGMKAYVSQYCRNCNSCRRSSVPRDKTPGLLHPLPIPSRPWEHVTMDYCSFNKDKYGFDNVLVIIDRFSKQAISIPCKKSISSREQAFLYIYHIYRYFGPPLTMLSDRGPQFISSFWQEFNSILGTKIKLSTADHPQTDGQTEIYNQYLQKRLRPFVNFYQDNWSDLLPMMDYAQLTLPHESLGGITPFEVVHGYPPRTTWDWNRSDTEARDNLNVQEARAMAQRHHSAWTFATSHLQAAQKRMSAKTNSHRRRIDFEIGDEVWLDMRHFPTNRPSRKLDFPTNGKFKIVEKVGNSFRVALPATMKVWDVFPPEKLRKASSDPLPGQIQEESHPINITGEEEYEVEEILACRRRWNQLEYRTTWLNRDVDLTWYPASNFKYAPHKVRDFHLANPEQVGPPKKLLDWMKAWEQGLEEYEELDNDEPMDKRSRASFFRKEGVM